MKINRAKTRDLLGGDEEIRTPDLLSAILALCVPPSAVLRCGPLSAAHSRCTGVALRPALTPSAVWSVSKPLADFHEAPGGRAAGYQPSPSLTIRWLWTMISHNCLRISNHRIRFVVPTERYTVWWVEHRQRRTHKELEAEAYGDAAPEDMSVNKSRIRNPG